MEPNFKPFNYKRALKTLIISTYCVTHPSRHVIKKSYQGDSIFSLLTILDMISLNKVSVRSEVYARADTDCYLLK